MALHCPADGAVRILRARSTVLLNFSCSPHHSLSDAPFPSPSHRVPEECPAEVRQLMLECLETRPSRRPTALQIVERLKQAPAQPPPGVEVRPPRRASREEEGQKPASGAEAAAAAASSSPAVQPLHQPEEPPSPPQEEEPGDEPGAAEAEVDP